MSKKPCECSDPQCPVRHLDMTQCGRKGSIVLYRIDMTDVSGTMMCHECAEDAWDSGVFSDVAANEPEEAYA